MTRYTLLALCLSLSFSPLTACTNAETCVPLPACEETCTDAKMQCGIWSDLETGRQHQVCVCSLDGAEYTMCEIPQFRPDQACEVGP